MLVLPADFTPASLPLHLSDGRDYGCTLRLLNKSDDEALLRFFRSHSKDTLYRRYGTDKVAMTHDRASKLVGVDQERDAAIGVFDDGEDPSHLVAVARYICATDGQQAEMAFVVHEKRRRKGLCSLMLQVLIHLARKQGLRQLFAQTQEDNFAMLGIFLKAGGIISIIEGTHAIDVQLPIPPPPAPAPKRRRVFSRR